MLVSFPLMTFFDLFLDIILYTALLFFVGDRYGPFYGPNVFDKVCGQKLAKSVKISYHNKKISEMVKICKGQSFTTHCDFIDSENQVCSD